MFLLDANVFIQAKNLEYGFDFCPAFWGWLDQQAAIRVVGSIEAIYDELVGVGDELETWARARDSFFDPPDASVVTALGAVSTWVTASPSYDAGAKNQFLQVADPLLVAAALAGGHTVVTHERVRGTRKRVMIPEVAIAFGVKCVNPYTMLRTTKARFVLGGAV